MLADLERTNGFVIGVDSRREWYRYHRLFAKLLRTRAGRELGARAAGAARAAPPAGTPRAGWARRRSSTPSPAQRMGPRGRARRRALVRPLRARPRRRDPRRSSTPLPPDRLESDAELGRGARVRGVRGRRRRGGARRTSSRRAEAGAALPDRAPPPLPRDDGARRLYRARLEGDFEAALEAADELLAEAAVHGGWSDDARQALVHASSGGPRCGRTSSTAPREELSRGVARRAPTGLDYVAVSALSYAGAAGRDGARPGGGGRCAREALELAEQRGWSTTPADGVRAHRRSRSPRSTTCARRGRAQHLERATATRRRGAPPARRVRARPPRRAHGGSAAGARRQALRALDDFEAVHRHRGAAPDPSRPRSPHARAAAGRVRGPRRAAAATLAPVARRAVARGRQVPRRGSRWPRASRRPRSRCSNGHVRRVRFTRQPRRARGARAIAHERPASPGGRGAALEQALELAETNRPPVDVPRARAPRGGPAAPADPGGHRAPRDRRRAAGHVRGPRAERTRRRAAAGAAVRPRAGDPALPADDALQPRDRRRAVRHDQHRQDAPAHRSTASSTSPAGARPWSAPATYGSFSVPALARSRRARAAAAASRRTGGRRTSRARASPALTPASASIAVRPASTKPSPPGVTGICASTCAPQNASRTRPGPRMRADRGERREQRQVVERPAPDGGQQRALPARPERGQQPVALAQEPIRQVLQRLRRAAEAVAYALGRAPDPRQRAVRGEQHRAERARRREHAQAGERRVRERVVHTAAEQRGDREHRHAPGPSRTRAR